MFMPAQQTTPKHKFPRRARYTITPLIMFLYYRNTIPPFSWIANNGYDPSVWLMYTVDALNPLYKKEVACPSARLQVNFVMFVRRRG